MRLAENVVAQNAGESLAAVLGDVLAKPSKARRPAFVHVVNPYRCESGTEGDRTQRLTYATMKTAAAAYGGSSPFRFGKKPVTHVAAAYAGDRNYARQFFRKIETIGRTAQDVGRFAIPKPLPPLWDILEAGIRHAAPDDFLVMTNSDICLTAGFYDAMASMISLGHDAILVNRRTIEKFPGSPGLAPLMGASIGACHPGFDCFVFRAGLFERFVRADSVIGRGFVMRPLIYNLVATSERMILLKDVHLTFHLGDDRPWSGMENEDYVEHNRREAAKVIAMSDTLGRRRLKDFCLNHGEPFGRELSFPNSPTAE